MQIAPFDRPTYLRRTAAWALGLIGVGAALYLAVTLRWLDLGALTRSHLAPWYSTWDPRLGGLWVVGTVLLFWPMMVPRLTMRRGSVRFALRALPAALLVWVMVSWSDGVKLGESRAGLTETTALTYPLARDAYEYIGDVPKVDELGPTGFLRAFHTPEVQERLAWHSKTHPPGPVLLLWGVSRVAGPSRGAAAAALLLFGALAVLAAYGLGRTTLTRDDARRLGVIFAVTPGVVLFFATSMEAVFTALMLGAAWPLTRSVRKRRMGAAFLGGALLGVATLFTYAAVLIAVWTAALWFLALARTPVERALWAVVPVQLVGFALPIAALAGVGYQPIASLSAALSADVQAVGTGTESVIRWAGVGIANLAAWAVSFGVASLAVFDRRLERTPELLAFLVVLVFAAFSTLFTLEVERIWLPLHALALLALLASVDTSRRPPVALWTTLLLGQAVLIEVLAETRW